MTRLGFLKAAMGKTANTYLKGQHWNLDYKVSDQRG